MSSNTSAATGPGQTDSLSVVQAFLGAFEALDLEQALSLLDDDCVYQNVPFHTARGKARITRDLRLLAKGLTQFEVQMKHLVVNGEVVMTERIDTLSSRWAKAAVPIMGVFVVRNGKICEWRDYFDWSLSFGRVLRSLLPKPLRRSRR